uniref:Uncharacterized protein n=1 Tax=Strigops habroptila TaxID=2489341 RepID=A0A672UDB6_STRHB
MPVCSPSRKKTSSVSVRQYSEVGGKQDEAVLEPEGNPAPPHPNCVFQVSRKLSEAKHISPLVLGRQDSVGEVKPQLLPEEIHLLDQDQLSPEEIHLPDQNQLPPEEIHLPDPDHLSPEEIHLPDQNQLPPEEIHLPDPDHLSPEEIHLPDQNQLSPEEIHLPDPDHLSPEEIHLPDQNQLSPEEIHLPDPDHLSPEEIHLPDQNQLSPEEIHLPDQNQLSPEEIPLPEDIHLPEEIHLPDQDQLPPEETHLPDQDQQEALEDVAVDGDLIFPDTPGDMADIQAADSKAGTTEVPLDSEKLLEVLEHFTGGDQHFPSLLPAPTRSLQPASQHQEHREAAGALKLVWDTPCTQTELKSSLFLPSL